MKLLWLDLETSGLDPQHDRILEVAYAFADMQLPLKIGPIKSHVLHVDNVFASGLSPFIHDMHTRNGLLAECSQSHVDVSMVGEEIAMHVERATHVPYVENKDERTVLAGASVHFGLNFIRAWMPGLAALLSHRVFDTSTIKMFCQSLGMPKLPKGEAHRATEDVLEAVQQGQACHDWVRECRSSWMRT